MIYAIFRQQDKSHKVIEFETVQKAREKPLERRESLCFMTSSKDRADRLAAKLTATLKK